MRVISDVHIHSRYSRACSRDLNPENLDKWGRIKGVNLLGTGDFTHPAWRAELKEKLDPAEAGFYKLRSPSPHSSPIKGEEEKRNFPPLDGEGKGGVRFVLSSEVACIYSQGAKKMRRVHYVILLPSFAAVEKFTSSLEKRGGKLASDGRPILGMNSVEILKYLLDADEKALMIPAHAWTPYFGIFGSKSGFDSIEECFGDFSKYIYAFETGLSSDPEMNWRFSGTDKYSIISASDAHSLPRIGREATVMEIPERELSYHEYFRILKDKDRARFKATIEYFPEEGKYHLDGHGPCGVSFTPAQTKRAGGRCPKCGRLLVVGVVSRVNDLADRKEGFVPETAVPQKHLVPLEEVLADCFDVGSKSKKIQDIYWSLINLAGNEFNVILDMPIPELKKVAGELVAEAVRRVREEQVIKIPGYDGVYGIIKVFKDGERDKFVNNSQKSLF
ncbi:MAG: hypothetical protein A2846_00130 [Candidatus Doudnabacteria bacterium RIFCSPHIGHO2_01_FULL_49_9]|uniref:DNA helicase UvrD n=1 Tax=Candidatus Doudnabacteria bacterium RIFCSPHIGHO2_01_FULL_49_9 TaxID=1817827 RepID=A0A1F5P1L8_9BACT|nr:MAG: hypothetical protein A2846_00130 [Candidatus Doudnabacteria bacterium RIFCSPHIGHO2_01_FULL_49_9]